MGGASQKVDFVGVRNMCWNFAWISCLLENQQDSENWLAIQCMVHLPSHVYYVSMRVFHWAH